MIGSLQALEALKFLTGAQPPLVDAFLQVDLATLRDDARQRERRPDCPDCGGLAFATDAGSEDDPPACPASCAATSQAVRERDPAATGVSTFEILTGWPGLHALLAHRVAHALDAAGVPVAPARCSRTSRAR